MTNNNVTFILTLVFRTNTVRTENRTGENSNEGESSKQG